MVEVQWFYARDDKQHGPVSGAELKLLAASGRLTAADLIWREGMEEWAPAGRLKGLFPEAKPGVGAGYGIAPPSSNVPHAAGATPSAGVPTGAQAGALHVGVDHDEPLAATPSAPISGIGSIHQPVAGAASDRAIAPQLPASASHPPTADAPAEPQPLRLSTPMALMLLQAFLWGTCVLVVLVGVALFTGAFMCAKEPAESASAGVVFVTFFIAAYVLARAGEKSSQLMLAYLRRKGGG